jgi:CheY-like chemotaxis protein
MNAKIAYLIDDDPDEQDFFEEALKDLDRGIQLIYGNDSRDAVKKLKRGNFIPDFIFLDINMPSLNGWECMTQIQNLEHLLNTPIAIYSTTLPDSIPAEAESIRIAEMIRKQSSITDLKNVLNDFFKKYDSDRTLSGNTKHIY